MRHNWQTGGLNNHTILKFGGIYHIFARAQLKNKVTESTQCIAGPDLGEGPWGPGPQASHQTLQFLFRAHYRVNWGLWDIR